MLENDLKKLFKLCTKENIFLFNGLLYQQVDDVTMGRPLGLLLANIFMSHVEKLLFNSDLKEEVNFWVRYVHGVFVILAKVNPNINNILVFLSKIHPNMKFTVDHEINLCLHFWILKLHLLMVYLQRLHIIYRFTSTNLNTVCNNFCPLSYKLSTIRGLFNLPIKLCSDNSSLLKEKLKLIKSFAKE